jgi:hypothetical protein
VFGCRTQHCGELRKGIELILHPTFLSLTIFEACSASSVKVVASWRRRQKSLAAYLLAALCARLPADSCHAANEVDSS